MAGDLLTSGPNLPPPPGSFRVKSYPFILSLHHLEDVSGVNEYNKMFYRYWKVVFFFPFLIWFWKGGYFKSIKEMKVLQLLCRVPERQESCQMAQIVCPILLVCNSGSHHKMSISLIFLTSVHQVDMKNWCQRLDATFFDSINLPRYENF